MAQEKARSEETLQLLRQRLRCSIDLISNMEKKVNQADTDRVAAEELIKRKDAANKKLALQNTNLNKSISDLKMALNSTIPKVDHEREVEKANAQSSEKDAVISCLSAQLNEVRIAFNQCETDLRDARCAYCDLESRSIEKDNQLSRIRREYDLVADHLRNSQDELRSQTYNYQEPFKSMEQHQSLALSMIEKTHACQLRKLQTELELTSKLVRLKDSQLDQMHAKLVELEIRVTDQQSREICIDIGVQSDTDMQTQGCQTNFIVLRPVSTETENEEAEHIFCSLTQKQVDELRKHMCCSSCRDSIARPVSTLFPCGHGLCSDCVATVMQSDLNRVGIACEECANNLPVTRISLNYPLIALTDYLSSILPPRDC